MPFRVAAAAERRAISNVATRWFSLDSEDSGWSSSCASARTTLRPSLLDASSLLLLSPLPPPLLPPPPPPLLALFAGDEGEVSGCQGLPSSPTKESSSEAALGSRKDLWRRGVVCGVEVEGCTRPRLGDSIGCGAVVGRRDPEGVAPGCSNGKPVCRRSAASTSLCARTCAQS